MIQKVAPLFIIVLLASPLMGVLTVNHTNGGIQVDGYRENAWDNASQLDLSRLVHGSVWGDGDFAARGWVLWNEVGLYLFVEIEDDVFVDNESIFNYPWEDDTIELYFDINNSKNNGFYDADDIQVFINFENTWRRHNNYDLNVGQISTVTTRDANTGKKTLEVLVPWNFFQKDTVQGGQQIGFDLLLNDDDDGWSGDAKFAWNMPANEAFFDPSVMGTLELGGSASYTFTSPSHQRIDHVLYAVAEYEDTPASISLQEAAQWAQAMEDFYRDSSDGRYLVEIDLVPQIIKLPGTLTEYEQVVRDLGTDFRQHIVANDDYTSLSGHSYDYHIYSYPWTWREYGGAFDKGVVWVDGTGPGSSYSNHAEGWTLIAHEMGHAIGLSHAAMTTGQRISPLAAGQWMEYGSPEDIMGNPPSYGEFGLPYKYRLGWLVPNQVQVNPPYGTYRIFAHDQDRGSEVHGLRLTNPRLERGVKDYWVSLRAHSAVENQPVVQVHLSTAEVSYHHGFYASELLDMTPEDGDAWHNEIPSGQWYWDSWNNHAFRIVAKGTTGGKAWADVEYQPMFGGADREVLHAHLGPIHSYHDGWTYTEDLGFLQLVRNGYAYHPQKGWLCIAQGDLENGLILYHPVERNWYFCSRQTGLRRIP